MADIDDLSPSIPPVSEPLPSPKPQPNWPTWLEILLCSGYPTQILLGQFLVLYGIPPLHGDGSLNATFVFAVSFADTVVLISLMVSLLRWRGERPSEVFFGLRPAGPEVVAGFFSFPLIITLVVALTLAIQRGMPVLHNVPDNPLEGMIGSGANLWMFLMLVIVAGGVREELQRAFLLHRFRKDLGRPWIGLLITSLAFGMGHTLQGLDAAVITGTLGAIWGAFYLIRGGALAAMVSHALFNTAELLQAFLR